MSLTSLTCFLEYNIFNFLSLQLWRKLVSGLWKTTVVHASDSPPFMGGALDAQIEPELASCSSRRCSWLVKRLLHSFISPGDALFWCLHFAMLKVYVVMYISKVFANGNWLSVPNIIWNVVLHFSPICLWKGYFELYIKSNWFNMTRRVCFALPLSVPKGDSSRDLLRLKLASFFL